MTDLYGLRKYKHQIAVLDSLRRRILLFLPVAALAELVSVCFVRIPEISPLQKMSKTTGRDGPREKMAEECGFPLPDLMEEEGPRIWRVSSDLDSC